MTCDDVFDALTANPPFTTIELDEHLGRCPRCRALQETLSPIQEAFREATASGDPPECALNLERQPATDSLQIAQESAARLQASSRDQRPRVTGRRTTWRYATAFLAGSVVALGLVVVTRSEPPASAPHIPPACLWQDRTVSQSNSEAVVRACVNCHLAVN